MFCQNVKLKQLNYKDTCMNKNYFLILLGTIFLSSCAAFGGKDAPPGDRLWADTTFETIPRHDSIDCYGSCTVKIYNP